jgi:Cu/Ag efflux protein CusF
MRMAKRRLAFAAMVAAVALCSAAAAQQTAHEGVFQGHGVVRAVEPGTGAVTIAHDEIKGFMPATERMFRVQEPGLSECLRPGDTVDFSIDAAEQAIVRVNLLYYDQ